MAVYRLFKNKAFEPEAITVMTAAYTDVCRALGFSPGDPGNHAEADMVARDMVANKELVAKKVIEFAQRGERDPARLRDFVLKSLRSDASGDTLHGSA